MGSEWIVGKLTGGVEWIQLAQVKDWWRSLVDTVTNPRVLAPRSDLVKTGAKVSKKQFYVCYRSIP
jgi:hypothetical protein